ncbi:MAG: hypothetical protein AAF368_04325 [Planctomycetota bacterium]
MFLNTPTVGGRAAFALCLALLPSCVLPQLEEEPWSRARQGDHVVGLGAGWGWADAKIDVEATSGFLDGRTGDDSGSLTPEAGGALRYQYLWTDQFRLGAALDIRHVESAPLAPLGIGPVLPQIRSEAFTSVHLILQPRWYTKPFGKTGRWRGILGADFGWVPGVDLDATVVYGGGTFEPIEFEGDDYFTLAPVVGLALALTDRVSLDFGAFYEFPLGASNDTVPLLIVNSDLDSEVNHEGLLIWFSFNLHL